MSGLEIQEERKTVIFSYSVLSLRTSSSTSTYYQPLKDQLVYGLLCNGTTSLAENFGVEASLYNNHNLK